MEETIKRRIEYLKGEQDELIRRFSATGLPLSVDTIISISEKLNQTQIRIDELNFILGKIKK